MKCRFLEPLFGVFLAFGAGASSADSTRSLYEHELLGQCFVSQADALKPFLLPDGSRDENIATAGSSISKGSTWVIDKTGGHNHQWLLLEKSDRGHCYTLFVPFAAQALPTRVEGRAAIQAKTQPSPGGESYEMVFRRSAKLGRFVPYKCYKVLDQTDPQRPAEIDCLAVADR